VQLTLYDYWRSGASHRVRIALHLKRLDFAPSAKRHTVGEIRKAWSPASRRTT
jgi:glutathione S-transferase